MSILLPAAIKYLLDNYEAEDIHSSITKADFSGETPIINFTIQELGSQPQNWILEVIGHRASELSFTAIVDNTTMLLTSDHPLLWQYADIQCELYFNGTNENVHKVIVALNQIDFALFGKYQHSTEQLYTLLGTSNGMLAKGSKKLLTKYADCLNKHGIKSSLVGDYRPTYFHGEKAYSGETLNLFLFGASYIVGQDFVFSKTD